MAIKIDKDRYKCFFCEEEYEKELEADNCVLSHDIVYIPVTRDELGKLINYIYSLDDPPIQAVERMKKIQKRESIKK